MKKREISRIVLLVHPFYSFYLEASSPKGVADRRQALKNLRQLAAMWGREIQKAAENPETLVIVIKPHLPDGVNLEKIVGNQKEQHAILKSRPGIAAGILLLGRFLRRARSELQDRLIEFDRILRANTLKEEILKRGFFLNQNSLEGKSFGEWYDNCLRLETTLLESALGMRRRIAQNARKSVGATASFSTLTAKNLTFEKARQRRPRRKSG